MTIKECIDIVDNIKPNQYSVKDKVQWLSFIDQIIINDVLKTHEGYDGRYDDFEGYSEDKISTTLIVSSPYDRLYTAYLKMKIDSENGEMARYNNSAQLYNTYMLEYRKYYNKTHMPLDKFRKAQPKPKNNSNAISDAVYEKLKRDLYVLLSEDFAKNTSDDKLYDIVMKYVYNNVELLKGKDGDDGYSPKKYVDYFTSEDIASLGIDDKADKADVNAVSNEVKDIGKEVNTTKIDIQQIGDIASYLFSAAERKSYIVKKLTGTLAEDNYPSAIAVKTYVDDSVGEIEPVLDEIIDLQLSHIEVDNVIALQNSYIGGVN